MAEVETTVLKALLQEREPERIVDSVSTALSNAFAATAMVMWDCRVATACRVIRGEPIRDTMPDLEQLTPHLHESVLVVPLLIADRIGWVIELETASPDAGKPAMLDALAELGRVIGLTLERSANTVAVEAQLRASQARLARLGSSDVIAMMITTTDGRIVEANNALLHLLGYTRDDIIAGRMRWDTITPPEWAYTDVRAVAQLERDGVAPAYHKEYVRSDGVRVPVILGAASLGGDPHQSIVFVVDITAQKEVEYALERLNGELEERVTSRQQELRALAARLQSVREEQLADLSREIHDVLGQDLAVLQVDAAWLLRRLGEGNGNQAHLATRVRAMTERLDALFASVRRIASQLRPRILDDLGLVAAIEAHARELARTTGLKIELALPDELPLSRELMTAVYRIYQELLTNVLRHAGASRVEIAIWQEGSELCLQCVDDGRGISGDLAMTGSLGILGIRERALAFNGVFEIGPAPAGGTRAMLRIPFPEPTR